MSYDRPSYPAHAGPRAAHAEGGVRRRSDPGRPGSGSRDPTPRTPDRVADVLVTGLLVGGALVLELGRWLAENVRVRPVGRRRQ